MGSPCATTWRCQTRASICSVPWPQTAASPGVGGSSTASWRTGPNPPPPPAPLGQSSLPSRCSKLPLSQAQAAPGISAVGPGKGAPARSLLGFPTCVLPDPPREPPCPREEEEEEEEVKRPLPTGNREGLLCPDSNGLAWPFGSVTTCQGRAVWAQSGTCR